MFFAAKRLADQNPVVMAAWVIKITYLCYKSIRNLLYDIQVMGVTGIVLPFIVVPIRSALGFKTNQYTKRMN